MYKAHDRYAARSYRVECKHPISSLCDTPKALVGQLLPLLNGPNFSFIGNIENQFT